MGMITKGMGIIRKELLKKSKKFPGPKSDKQLQKELDVEKQFQEEKELLDKVI